MCPLSSVSNPPPRARSHNRSHTLLHALFSSQAKSWLYGWASTAAWVYTCIQLAGRKKVLERS